MSGSAPPVQYASSGEVDVAYQMLGDGPFDLEFQDRGAASLKGVSGEWRLFALSGAGP